MFQKVARARVVESWYGFAEDAGRDRVVGLVVVAADGTERTLRLSILPAPQPPTPPSVTRIFHLSGPR